MDINAFSCRFYIIVSRLAIVSFIALAWSLPAFSGEIHEAAKAGDLAKVTALLKSNPALVSSRSDKGEMPLHAAAMNGHKAVVELLLASKADVNAREKAGYTPLHRAAVSGHKDVAELLLAKKADVNAKDNFGYTALHLAARKGYKDIVDLLLANKALVNARTIMGITPLDAATWDGFQEVVDLLRSHGAVNGVAGLYAPGKGVQEPVRLDSFTPPYTEAARRAQIEGTMVVQAIIRKNGAVTDIKIIKSLGFGLDESVVNTLATRWRFKPGIRNGEPVDVISTFEIQFTPQ